MTMNAPSKRAMRLTPRKDHISDELAAAERRAPQNPPTLATAPTMRIRKAAATQDQEIPGL